MTNIEQLLNSTIPTAQEIFTKKEKEAWARFEAIRDAKYEGKGSRAIKNKAIKEAREELLLTISLAENAYAKAVGAI